MSYSFILCSFQVSSNYLGYVEFRLCPRNTTKYGLDQSCFDRYTLWIDESHGTRYYIGSRGGIYDLHIRLPGGLVCKKCVLQWKFKTGMSVINVCFWSIKVLFATDLSILHENIFITFYNFYQGERVIMRF